MKNILFRIWDFIERQVASVINPILKNNLSVLMLHDISNRKSRYSITQEEFYRLIQNIGNSRFMSLDELYQALSERRMSSKVVLTFDDAYESVFEIAYPILKKYDIPFAIFICTSLIGKKGYLSKEQLYILSKENLCTIGSHSKLHIKHRLLDDETVRNLLLESILELKKNIGYDIKINYFAFPYGSHLACSLNNVEAAHSLGFKMIFSTSPFKIISFKKALYICPRINVTSDFIRISSM